MTSWLLWPPAAAELRSAWTGEGARPHTTPPARLLAEVVATSLPAVAINPIIEVGRESTAPTACLTRDFQRSYCWTPSLNAVTEQQGDFMSAPSRRPEIRRRRTRAEKIAKLRKRLAAASASNDKDRLTAKLQRAGLVSPGNPLIKSA